MNKLEEIKNYELRITNYNLKRGVCWSVIFAVLLLFILSCEKNSITNKKINDTSVVIPTFNKDESWQYLLTQFGFGDRSPGKEGHSQIVNYLYEEMQKYTGEIIKQDFTIYSAKRKGQKNLTYNLSNIGGIFSKGKNTKILLAAHFDNRPIAENDPDENKRQNYTPGANDGASGVAVLLELAKIFKNNPPPKEVTIIFFDAEDSGDIPPFDWCEGAKYFVNNYKNLNVNYGILLDMIGDKNLNIYEERNSLNKAPEIMDKIFSAAANLNYDKYFIASPGYMITDDHIPFLEKNIPVIDLIDFDYPSWHTTNDVLENCSADSLKIVGDVLLNLIYTEN